MEIPNHDRTIAANQDLRNFLRRAVRLANGNGTATERDLRALTLCLLARPPEIGDASRGEILDAHLLGEIAEYVKNFRALQRSVENIRDVMLASRIKLETAAPDVAGFPGWAHTDRQARK